MKSINVEPNQWEFKPFYSCRALIRAIIIALVILPSGCNKDEQQDRKAPSGQPSISTANPLTDLESLLAPIALYPDPLLAELLVASTYPLEVVQAARWLETQPDLTALSSKDWDASIMRLASVPTVLKMMNDHLDWTTQLGDAFLAKPAEVMAVIQALRKRAMDAGYLKDTPEQQIDAQTVSTEQTAVVATPAVLTKEVITIKPAKSDTIYVPQYNPEVVYQAPMAPPPTGYPATTIVNVNASTPAPSYYPATTTTTTTTSNDSWVNFATGAVVGGLLTWGLMEWADDDYYVGHHYGNTVCHSGNCWLGGGYYGDRGYASHYNNVNISGNEINIDRDRVFNQNNLRPSQQPTGWRTDPRHRRGQAYPEGVRQRVGTGQPALAGQRLGSAQTLPANARGFAETGQRPAAGRRPSSADIQRQLAQKPAAKPKLAQSKPSTMDRQKQPAQRKPQNNALQGVKTPGNRSRMESQRGATSRKSVQAGTRDAQPRKPADRGQAYAQRERAQQQMAAQRRTEFARPNAFESPRNAAATQSFSQRGANSRGRATSAGNLPSRSGGGSAGRAGGGGRRR